MCEQEGQGKRQLCACLLPGVLKASLSPPSPSSWGQGRESCQERAALSSVAPIFPVTWYPRHQVRCPGSNLGAHLCWVWGCAQVPGHSLEFPLICHPETESWCQPHCPDPCGTGELMAAASTDLQSPAQNRAQLSCLLEAQERVKVLNYKQSW